MRMKKHGVRLLLLAVFSVLLSVFLTLVIETPGFMILAHSFQPRLLFVFIAALFFYAFLLGLWVFYSRFAAALFAAPQEDVLAADFLTYLPILLLSLAPLTLIHYLTSDDLLSRLELYGYGLVFCILYLKILQAARWAKQGRTPWAAWSKRFEALSLRKKLTVLFIASLLVFNAGSLILLHKGVSFSGDQPHYLLIDHSLLHDGDFDLANNYQNRDYLAYMPTGTTIKPHVVPGARPSSQYSFHSPGISFLLLPFYALGSLFGKSFLIFFLRFGVSLFGAALGLQVFLFALKEWKNERLALVLWALLSFTTPVYFYSIHVYPELVITLFSFTVFRLFRFPQSLSTKNLFWSGLLLSLFIWFHALKYIFLLAPLFIYCLWVLARTRRPLKDYSLFFLFPIVITGIYFFFQKSLYGSYSLSSISWRGSLGASESISYLKWLFTGIPFRYRWESLAGYFLDQKDGLLLYAPIYFFSLLGLVEMLKRKKRDFLLLLFIAAPYVLVSAFLTQRAGYSPQARPVVSVIWAAMIFLGYYLVHNRKKLFSRLFSGAVFLSLLFVWLLLQNPLNLYQETTLGATDRGGGLFYLLSNLNFQLPRYLPSFLKLEDGRWPPNFIWLGAVVLFIILYLIFKDPRWKIRFSLAPLFALGGFLAFFIWFVLFPRLILLNPVPATFPGGEKITFYQLSRVARIVQPGRFLLPEDNRAYLFTFVSREKNKAIEFELGSEDGDYSYDLTLFDQSFAKGKTEKEMKKLAFAQPPSYQMKTQSLYLVRLWLRKTSPGSTPASPFLFALRPVN